GFCINLPDESSKQNIDEIKWNNFESSASIALLEYETMRVSFIDLNNDI
ncbi:unnamed protein product, partial [Rotaria sp. Silwood1]